MVIDHGVRLDAGFPGPRLAAGAVPLPVRVEPNGAHPHRFRTPDIAIEIVAAANRPLRGMPQGLQRGLEDRPERRPDTDLVAEHPHPQDSPHSHPFLPPSKLLPPGPPGVRDESD